MTVKEFKTNNIVENAKKVNYYDINGINISNKPPIILNLLEVIGISVLSDGTVNVDVNYTE